MGKGRVALIGTYNYFYSNKYFDEKAKLIKYPTGDFFNSTSYGLTFMAGIGRKVDLNVSVPFVVQSITTSGVKQTNSGLGDANLGLSFHFPSESLTKSFTIKTGVILPLYQNDTLKTPYLGYASTGVQLGAAYAFSPFKQAYATLEFTYTRFLDASEGPNQYRGAFTLSKMLTNYTTLTGSFAHQISRSANTDFSQNISINKNFDGGTISLSLTQRITRTITPSIQGFYTLYGKNMGLGLGASFFVTVRIP
ncbi:MAG: hypothetical protein EAZ12_07620 [Sphingobacteriia bacterium]|nr:MAG: hypothetical protein EAZ12_07620 [Sphingobacteriia bacterium]